MAADKKTAIAHFIMAEGCGEKWQCPCECCNYAHNRVQNCSQEERKIFALCYILGQKISQKEFKDVIGNDKAMAALLKQKHEQAVAKKQHAIDLQKKQKKEPDELVRGNYSDGGFSYQTGGGRRIIRDTRGLS